VHLPCAPASVGVARRALIGELRASGVAEHAVRDAALVISELLSNAILHAYPLPGEQVQVTWSVDGEAVEIAVSDGGSPTVPYVSHPPVSATGGRGLAIVAYLSRDWGVRTDGVGLTVWAVLAAAQSNGHRGSDAYSRAPRPDLRPSRNMPNASSTTTTIQK
jgi:anti-sigma regulatory factor (Ser/Thr protein kinase)